MEFYRASIKRLDGDILDIQTRPITNESALIVADLRALKVEIEGRLAAVEEGTGAELGGVMITEDADYITILNARFDKKIVCIMKYHKPTDEYIQTQCSQAMKPEQAKFTADLWARRTGLEIR